jgi:hypothetical protein
MWLLACVPDGCSPWDARLIVTRDAAAKGLVACSEGRRWEREYQALDDKAPSDPKAAAKALKKRSKRERQALELQEMQVWFAPPGGVKGPKGHEQLGDAAYEGAIQGLDAGCASQLLAGAYQQWFAAAAAHRVGMGFNGLQVSCIGWATACRVTGRAARAGEVRTLPRLLLPCCLPPALCHGFRSPSTVSPLSPGGSSHA